ncbi:hypothetical protein [Methylobacterium oryzihabitans]|uniref:hypothetical protein n=1 Tax=Methylobacterium oryzihabitans TaxID=2499852 RepID=UPI00165281D7|nr:hypothetical protein [Methylobacterium oryzihabitans]
MTDDIGALLQHLWILNDKDDVRQAREEACDPAYGIAALDPATTLAMSPMLRARYAFADAWHGAAYGQTWLALGAVATASAQLRERAWHHAQMETLAETFPRGIDPARMALFGIDEDRGGATYLIWRPDGTEPMVCAFYGGGLDIFASLGRYLEFLIGERVHDDSAELLAAAGVRVRPVAQSLVPDNIP